MSEGAAGGRSALVLTASDRSAAGTREDQSGDALSQRLEGLGFAVERAVVADDRTEIAARLRDAAERHALIVTTGGTGLTPNDITPEATRAVIDREAPGFAEAMRAEASRHTPMGMLSRGISGISGQTLIVNFPGSPKAIDELFGVLAPTLGHVVRTLRGDSRHDGHR